MASQIYVVVMYPDSHRQVGLLYPMELTELSVLDLAQVIAHEGKASGHCTDGDRVRFAAVKAADSLMACNIASDVPSKRLVHGEFTL